MSLRDLFFRIYHWETWHYLAKYIPISPAWFWYCLRSRSFWFFTPSNPGLSFGGFEGERKSEMYRQLPPGSYPKTIYIKALTDYPGIEDSFLANGFKYPVAVKPDAGMMGLMFRRINSAADLASYHATMKVDYIIQELVTYPLEVSVFYYRLPHESGGTITGFLKKEFLEVVGDGHSTLWELMRNYPRVRFRLEEMRLKHEGRLQDVLPWGEIYCLSYALNLSRGGRLVSLEHEKDEQLLKVFDALSNYTRHFYYGRYDIKCQSVEDLKQGRNFSILEYNGCGAEPHHVYGNGNNIFQAYRILLHHWKILYKISRYNHRRGIRHWDFRRGWEFLKQGKKNFRLLKRMDAEFPAS